MKWKICKYLVVLGFLTSFAPPPHIIRSTYEYLHTIEQDPAKTMVNLKDFVPTLILDIRYASKNNFLKRPLYEKAAAYVRFPVAIKLKKIQEELEPLGLGLKIFDAYRPYSVTLEMWQSTNGSPFVANPAYGSIHNRGTAVDLSLINLADSSDIPMPSQYDEFNVKASHQYINIPRNLINNRNLLKRIMEKHGFKANEYEWWHYDFLWSKEFEILDLTFEMLERLEKKP